MQQDIKFEHLIQDETNFFPILELELQCFFDIDLFVAEVKIKNYKTQND